MNSNVMPGPLRGGAQPRRGFSADGVPSAVSTGSFNRSGGACSVSGSSSGRCSGLSERLSNISPAGPHLLERRPVGGQWMDHVGAVEKSKRAEKKEKQGGDYAEHKEKVRESQDIGLQGQLQHKNGGHLARKRH